MTAEAEHTAPSEWCPRPGLWSAADGWATEDEVGELLGALVRASKPTLAVETGSYLGDTTARLGAAIWENEHGRLVSFEIDPVRAAVARSRCDGLPVEVLERDVRDWSPDAPVGFAFIDSDPGGRPGEIEHLWEYLEDGAIVAVHDTAPHHGADLERLARGCAAINLRTPRGLLVYQKGGPG